MVWDTVDISSGNENEGSLAITVDSYGWTYVESKILRERLQTIGDATHCDQNKQ